MAVLLNYVLVASLVGTVSAFLLLLLFCAVQNQSEHFRFNMLFCSVLLPYFGCAFSPFIQLDVFRKDASAEIISSIKSKFGAVNVTDLAVPLCEKASPDIFKILFCIWLFVTLILIFKTALSHFSYLKAIEGSAAFMFKIGRVNVYGVNASAVINIEADFSAEYSYDAETGERLSVGYIFDGTAYEIFSGRVKCDGLAVEFTANQTGEYLFYICNFSAGMQNYSNVEISVL